ncbi:MAG: hypothetical protein QMD85_01685, partial [Candidatus Aenigmarchaeota archaeon]|nr:hypothetical protein [Candidatus Aenigmarchaeota archaeon]MDI6722258.1 hypothetical protein [Candidatus Aenigmarchaeota archaeon]
MSDLAREILEIESEIGGFEVDKYIEELERLSDRVFKTIRSNTTEPKSTEDFLRCLGIELTSLYYKIDKALYEKNTKNPAANETKVQKPKAQKTIDAMNSYIFWDEKYG